jgi:hypothetical protein
MKLRTVLFLSVILLAVGANFAFTTNKQNTTYGYYYNRVGLCELGEIYEDLDCNPTGTGPECTIFDGTTGLYKPAYEMHESEFVCESPLYQVE